MKKLLTEFIGTFIFVFTIGGLVNSGAGAPAILGIGITLMFLVYMGGSISGGHYNPAVTVAALITKKLDAAMAMQYMVVQFIGGFLGALTSAWVVGTPFACSPGQGVGTPQALANEIIFTFALVLTVLNTACSKRMENVNVYGLAIGGVIMAAAYAGGGISGGAYNPAIGVGSILSSMVNHQGTLDNVWLYIVGPVVGAIIAAMIFQIQEKPEATG